MKKHKTLSVTINQMKKTEIFFDGNEKTESGNITYPHNTRPPIESKSVWQ